MSTTFRRARSGLYVPRSAGGYDAAVLARSPRDYLKLDETSGTNAVNDGGGGGVFTSANCTLNQASLLPSGVACYDFNGTSSQITSPYTSDPASWTLRAVIRPDVVTFNAIAAKDGSGTGWAMYVASGKLDTYVDGVAHIGSATLSTATVYHVGATYDPSVGSGTLKQYINGALDSTFTSVGFHGTGAGSVFMVGVSTGSNGGASRFFWWDGKIDALSFESGVRTAAEFAADYAAA